MGYESMKRNRYTVPQRKTLAVRAVNEILDKGLSDSTFSEKFPTAYQELCHYRADMAGSIEKVLVRSRV
jgi:hypothetical protein